MLVVRSRGPTNNTSTPSTAADTAWPIARPGLLDRVDVGHHDAVGPEIQRPLEPGGFLLGDAHDARGARRRERLQLMEQGFLRAGPVLVVEHEPVKPGVPGNLRSDAGTMLRPMTPVPTKPRERVLH